jgi:hypothetical protein
LRSTASRLLLALAVVAAGPARAQEAAGERHPRAPDQPLPIVFKPFYCSRCVEEKLIPDEPRDVELMNRGAKDLATAVGIKRDWIVIETPNFRIFSNLKGEKVSNGDSPFAAGDLQRMKEIFPSFKPGGQGAYLDAHQRAHMYHIRVERLLSHFRALTGNEEPRLGMEGRYEVYLFEDTDQYRAFTETMLGHPYNPNCRIEREHVLEGYRRIVFATAAEVNKGGDRQLNNAVAHHTGHSMVSGHHQYRKSAWGWLDAGVAHFYERRESFQFNCFCMQGTDPPRDFERGDWRERIRHLVYRKKEPSFGDFCEKASPQTLAPDDHAYAWSYVDWLIATDPARFTKLLDIAKDPARKGSCADAIQDVFGITPFALHERWRAYVLEAYGS